MALNYPPPSHLFTFSPSRVGRPPRRGCPNRTAVVRACGLRGAQMEALLSTLADGVGRGADATTHGKCLAPSPNRGTRPLPLGCVSPACVHDGAIVPRARGISHQARSVTNSVVLWCRLNGWPPPRADGRSRKHPRCGAGPGMSLCAHCNPTSRCCGGPEARLGKEPAVSGTYLCQARFAALSLTSPMQTQRGTFEALY